MPPSLALTAHARGARLAAAEESAADDAELVADRRLYHVSVLGTLTIYWEYIGAPLASGLLGCSYVAPTTCDSMPGVNPYTDFMV